ncbi:hypothetical protein C8T65DRAFT_58812 [Cerioporus squamosus]|nr:hypothetical protein C8T65DRAFT_58812 [Cerioporus squamosus]
MNSRYDRMIQTVNVLHATPASTTRSRRQRAASSSSATTYETPRTPANAYSSFNGGALGEDFSVLEMDYPMSSAKARDPFDPSVFCDLDEDAQTIDATRHLPPWLHGTITTLGSKHPLRLLLPTSDSSRPIPDGSSDSAGQLAAENSPFAFVPPAEPELPAASEPFLRDFAPVEPTSDYTDEQYVNHKIPPVCLASPEEQTPSPRLSARSELPFSTAGPASTSSAFTDITSAHTAPINPDLTAISTYLASYTVPMPIPFSTPGPGLTGDDASLAVPDARPAPVSPAFVLPSGLSQPSLALASLQSGWPFSTPGPLMLSTVSAHADFRHSSANPASLLSSTEDSPGSSHQIRHAPWVLGPPGSTSIPPSPASRSVGRFMPGIAKSYGFNCAPGLHGFEIEVDGTPHKQLVDYEALGFKWEKFDRGDIVLNAPSSPPLPTDSDSEEVFWSQPGVPEPHTPTRADSLKHIRPRRLPPSPRLPLSDSVGSRRRTYRAPTFGIMPRRNPAFHRPAFTRPRARNRAKTAVPLSGL